ncbi:MULTISPECIES: alpha/beta hydrolase [Staphylococcus]|uniref:alpha/beta hydrolase n=1 Tax=Staphylococcus TaxID=1279 RepID=UPI0008A21B6D|nr:MULTISPECIES: alpha/beta fold hydrolase [Staphylococcus]PIS62591.1 carboxylesterase [Corynebacterium striatum]MDK7752899.1 alpha/beta fold hydrolase [Staphylococcus sp. UMB10092B]MDT3982362.1 alpha/beta fold hydrolase [Staphylococcus ureilyticus]OFQ93357.1 carboxylesterase [Staphylococcus sp. HMSC065A08]OHO39133.1 carboxylesterase [Staphylococcus sp. HMSC034G07]
MINVKEPNPIFLENKSSERAILLLHSFTGTIRDVKLLATKLNKAGFTCYAPSYKGHGLLLESLMAYDAEDWWQDALEGYQYLQDQGYSNISVCGISLGGILSLKLAEEKQVASVAVMSTPLSKDDAGLAKRLEFYGERMGNLVGLSQEAIQQQMNQIENYAVGFDKFKKLVDDAMAHLNQISVPIAIKFGEQDEKAYEASANYIYNQIEHEDKEIQGYPTCKHLMTYGEGHLDVEQDVIAFFEDYT